MRRHLEIISIGIVLMILESSFAQTVPTIIRGQYLYDSLQTLVLNDSWFEKSKDQVDGRFSQGVATDGVFWYFSSRGGLYKTDAYFNMLIEKDGTQNPIPGFLWDQGYNHIGDIAYFVGKLYAPIEDVSYVKPIIGIYDADSLNFTGEFVQVPQSHFPWIAVDPRTGYFYSSEFSGVNKLFVYDPEQNFSLIDEIPLNLTLSRVQGGAFLGDFLYLACDNGDYVYEVEVASGAVTPVIIVPLGPEMEGIEAYELDSGVLHFVAETGGSTNIFYHYGTPLAHDLMVRSIVWPNPKMPIWGNITPTVKIWNIGENNEEIVQLVCSIDTSGVELYRNVQIIADLASLADSTVSFARWTPQKAGLYNFSFYTELSNDLDTSNDTLRLAVDVSNVVDDFEYGMEKWEQDMGWKLSLMGQGHNSLFSLWSTPRPYANNTNNPVTFISFFDFSGFLAQDILTLNLWTKNRLEEGKDFLYVEASADGNNWSQLGCFTGRQENWIQTFHSLGSFSGPGNDNVSIRFRLVTDSSGTDSGVRIDDVGIFFSIQTLKEEEIPKIFNLFQNYPNPFNLQTVISYEVPVFGDFSSITLKIYNLLGQEIRTLVNEPQPAARYMVAWDGRDNDSREVTSGIYLYQLRAHMGLGIGEFSSAKKMVYLK